MSIPYTLPSFDGLPDSPTLAEFLEHPLDYKPLPEYATSVYIEDETVLTHCVKMQSVDAVASLIKAGADPNQPSKKGVTPISAAAHKGNVLIMQMLIDSGASVNSINSSGSTALIQAAHFGHLDAVVLLLHHAAAADFANVKGTTALMRASQEGHLEISRALINSKVDVNRKNHEGMNALMLASQRGHADIVLLLIKAGATMDEQTSQGSTALMLACKRGHERCAEVLVSMGAEIYMVDRRGRTARDTATRRNHFGLLRWLTTQAQVSRVQECHARQRAIHLIEMRRAYQEGRLVLNSTDSFMQTLVTAIQSTIPKGEQPLFTQRALTYSNVEKMRSFRSIISDFGQAHPAGQPTIEHIKKLITEQDIRELTPVYRKDDRLSKKFPGYEEWQWPLILYKCFGLPHGVFELVMEMLPLPRIWQWSLTRLRKRCKLSPNQAMVDIYCITDEIIADSCLFMGEQKLAMIKINRNPQFHEVLRANALPASLIEELCKWADTQALLSRTVENEVGFKSTIARELLNVAIALYKWQKNRSNSTKMFHLHTVTMDGTSLTGGSNAKIASMKRTGLIGTSSRSSGMEQMDVEDAELLEATDAGGDLEGSDNEDDETGAIIDHDTETEIGNNNVQLDGEVDDDLLDDSDTDMVLVDPHNMFYGNI